MAASEQTATEFITSLSGNGGSINSSVTSMLVADALPSGLSTPFRAVIYASGATKGEIVRVTAVSTLTWTIVRGQETTLGAPAASSHSDGDSIAVVLTATGLPKVLLDGTAASTSAVGDNASAGSVGLAADSGHVHGREAFATNTIALGTAAAAGSATTHIRSDGTILAFDTTVPTTSAFGDTAATGSATVAARRDHLHGRGSLATNAIVLGSSAAAGSATTTFRSDDTIAAFDGTAPTTAAVGDVAAAGSVAKAARRDHLHGQPGMLAPLQFWGDASDGTVTISGATSLSRDMYYDTLTVNTSQALSGLGYRIFVANTLTNNGTIRPSTAQNGGAGGGAGGNTCTGFFSGAAGGSSVIATGGNVGTATSASYGGAGKTGGNGSVHNGAAGGTLTTPTIDTRRGPFGLRFMDYTPTGLGGVVQENFYEGGSGGGGGGTDGTNVGGGGGGGNGGLAIAARIFVNTSGSVIAPGGAGGSPSTGNCGGGGGGGGGFLVIHSTSASTGTVTALGGAGGTKTGTGTNGTAGNNGTTLWIVWAA